MGQVGHVMEPRPRVWISALASLATAAFGGLLTYYGTAQHPWAYSDGVGYLTIADNLVHGIGLGLLKPSGEFEALVSHPPGYPLLLAGLSKLGLTTLDASRWIDIAAFAVLLAATVWYVQGSTGSLLAGLATAAVLSVTPPLILLYLSTMAEPAFLALGFLSLFWIARYAQGAPGRMWIASAIAAGAATLIRYPGIAFTASCLLVIALQVRTSRRRRARLGAAYATIALTPLAALLAQRTLLAHTSGPKALSLEGTASLAGFLKMGASTLWSWKPIPPASVLDLHLSGSWSTAFSAAVPLLLGIGGVALADTALQRIRAERRVPERRMGSQLLSTFLIFACVYPVLYALVYLVSYPTPDVDSRTLLPILPALLIALILLGREAAIAGRGAKLLPTGLAAGLVGILLGYGVMSYDIVSGMHRTGGGYTGTAWRASETLEAIRTLPTANPLLSNAPEAVLLYTGRYPHSLVDAAAGPGCPSAVRSVLDEGGIVVAFDPDALAGARSWNAEQVIAACGLRAIGEWPDGAIYEP
jgi:hypothetical protein